MKHVDHTTNLMHLTAKELWDERQEQINKLKLDPGNRFANKMLHKINRELDRRGITR